MLLTTGTRARTAHPIDASGFRRSQSGVGIAADERGTSNGNEHRAGRTSRAGKRVGVGRTYVVRVAAAMMVWIALVSIGSDLIPVAIKVRRGLVLAGLDAPTDFSRMRHPDPGGQDEH